MVYVIYSGKRRFCFTSTLAAAKFAAKAKRGYNRLHRIQGPVFIVGPDGKPVQW